MAMAIPNHRRNLGTGRYVREIHGFALTREAWESIEQKAYEDSGGYSLSKTDWRQLGWKVPAGEEGELERNHGPGPRNWIKIYGPHQVVPCRKGEMKDLMAKFRQPEAGKKR